MKTEPVSISRLMTALTPPIRASARLLARTAAETGERSCRPPWMRCTADIALVH
jgi:hypothetical protein